MANNFGTQPWYVDTVMATPLKYPVRITNIIWSKQAAPGDELIIKDGQGNTLIDTKAQAANYQQVLGGFGWVNGFQVTTLVSGVVTVIVSKV